jgi:hypothetical protein
MWTMKKNLFLFFTFISIAFCNTAFCQDFFPRNFNDLYTVNKNENDSFTGIINERYLKLKDFYPINDSVFTTKDKKDVLIFHFKLNNPKFYEVSVEYLLENPQNLTIFLERIGDKVTTAFSKNNYVFLEEQSSNKRQSVSLSIRKDEIFQGKKLNNIKFTFTEKLLDNTGKSYEWRKSEHQLSNAYPLQNSLWYFDTKTVTEENADNWGSTKITTLLYCSKTPKYPHKIQFLNDQDYVVTYFKDKKPKTLTGNYRTNSKEIYGEGNQLIDVDFDIDIKFRQETTTTEVVETGHTSEPLKVNELTKYDKISEWDYLYEMFRYSYELDHSDNDIILTHITFSGGNYPVEMAPSNTPVPKENKN